MAVTIRNIDWRKVNRVAIAFVLIVSFLCLVCWTAPQAHAITLTVTAGIVLLCTVLLAAFGVSITAPNNTSAIDFFTPKILSFAQSKGYSSIEDWVAGETGRRPTLVTLFSLVGSALVIDSPLWNCLLEYTKSFVEDEDITPSGPPVGQLPISTEIQYVTGTNTILNGNVTATWTSDTTLHVITPTGTWKSGQYNHNYSIAFASSVLEFPLNGTVNWITKNGYSISNITIGGGPQPGSQNSTYTIMTNQSYSNSFINYASPSYNNYFTIKFNGNSSYSTNTTFGPTEFYITFNDAQAQQPGGTVVTPSDTITEPDPLDLGLNGLVYVPGLVDSMSIEDALNHIADKTATPGGLTASSSVVGYEIPEGSEWLYDQLNDINGQLSEQNPHTDWIPNDPFNFSLYDIWHYVTEWLQSWSQGLQTFLTLKNLSIPAQFTGIFYGVFVAAVVIGIWRRFFE